MIIFIILALWGFNKLEPYVKTDTQKGEMKMHIRLGVVNMKKHNF